MKKIDLYTIGFTKKSAEEFFESIKNNKIKRIIDIRLNNASQLSGFAKKNDIKYFLEKICDIDYVYSPELAPTKTILDEYKKYKGSWENYERKFIKLIEQRHIEKLPKDMFQDACLLCSENKPHHCHRRLIAEYLKEKWDDDLKIIHL